MATLEETLQQFLREISSLRAEVAVLKRTAPTGYMAAGKVRDITVSAGELDPVFAHYAVIPQTGTTDDVNTINVERAGRKVMFRIKTPGDAITFKDGVDNLNLSGGDVVLNDVDMYLTVVYDDENEEWKIYAKGF